VVSFVRETVFSEDTASLKGFMQGIDPRWKVLGVLLLVILAVTSRNAGFISGLYLYCILLAFLSGIGIRVFLVRTWVFIPLFSAFIIIPAIFSFATPGMPVISIGRVSITREGLGIAGTFVLRVVTAVSFTVLLSLTTRHTELLKALRFFKVPDVFVMTIGMCYKYAHILAGMVENVFVSMKARGGSAMPARAARRTVSSAIAGLWHRSSDMSSEVYRAMLSRGYDGEPRVLAGSRSGTRDILWMISAGIVLLFFLATKG
jgi:cobalt/nickel transport system permease protein